MADAEGVARADDVHVGLGEVERAVESLKHIRPADVDYKRALEFFTKAAAADPDNARYRANMAMSVGMLGRYDEALTLYMQILSPADAHFNLGVICEARDDLDRAFEEYGKAKKSAGQK